MQFFPLSEMNGNGQRHTRDTTANGEEIKEGIFGFPVHHCCRYSTAN